MQAPISNSVSQGPSSEILKETKYVKKRSFREVTDTTNSADFYDANYRETNGSSSQEFAKHLSCHFASIINSKNPDILKQFFQLNCTDDCSILHHVYKFESMSDLNEAENIESIKESNPFGPYKDLSFPSIPIFIEFMTNCWRTMPDMVLYILNARECTSDEEASSLYMMGFEINGKLCTGCPQLVRFENEGSEWTVIDHTSLQPSLDVLDKEDLKIKGSLAFYVDDSGVISSLEFFYEFLK